MLALHYNIICIFPISMATNSVWEYLQFKSVHAVRMYVLEVIAF